jgi:DNA polymerase V
MEHKSYKLMKDGAATFFVRVEGDSMQDAGIYDGNLLVVDKSLHPQDGDIVVCFLDGEFTLKYIQIEQDAVWLIPANKEFQPIKVTAGNEFIIWGIVTYSIKKHRNTRR